MNALPNLQDLAHEGRPSSESRLRPVLGQGGVEHDAGAFVRSAQGGTGGDCGGAEGVVGKAPGLEIRRIASTARGCSEVHAYLHANIWHARGESLNGRRETGIGFTENEAIADFYRRWNGGEG